MSAPKQWEERQADGLYIALPPLANVLVEHASVNCLPWVTVDTPECAAFAVVFLPFPVMKASGVESCFIFSLAS